MVSERASAVEQGRRFLERALAARPGARLLVALPGEASQRCFFRVFGPGPTRVAMVYPQPAATEIARLVDVAGLLKRHGLRVPEIHEVLGNQALLMEDGGDLLLQRAWRQGTGRERDRLLAAAADVLLQLRLIPAAATPSRLDPARQQAEMDFFVDHYVRGWRSVPAAEAAAVRRELHALVARIEPESVFAHRDFHSRNLLVRGRRLLLVDFQDALQAPPLYDLVSLAWDAYLDLGSRREWLLDRLRRGGLAVQERSLRLAALQRNVKALGTFAFQVTRRGHRGYARYVPRTLNHIRDHFRVLGDPALERLRSFFTGPAVG